MLSRFIEVISTNLENAICSSYKNYYFLNENPLLQDTEVQFIPKLYQVLSYMVMLE